MSSSLDHAYCLPLDDQGPFEDLDRIRIDMLNEGPPEPAESVFAGAWSCGGPVIERLRFFRWVLHDLYGGEIGRWEASLERRDERLHAMHQDRAAQDATRCAA